MDVRPGRPSDLDDLERIEHAAFVSDRLSRRSLRYFLSAPTTAVPVALKGERLAGYAMIGFRADSRRGRIFSLAVDPACARQGIGRALLDACESAASARRCGAVRLEVRADNAAALGLYRNAGYRVFATVADYYEDGSTALRLEKPLRPEDGT